MREDIAAGKYTVAAFLPVLCNPTYCLMLENHAPKREGFE